MINFQPIIIMEMQFRVTIQYGTTNYLYVSSHQYSTSVVNENN